jgi:hypothetical protein
VLSGSGDGTVRIWDTATGNEIAQFISFSGTDSQLTAGSRDLSFDLEEAVSSIDGEWVCITPDGYYAASPQGDRYLNVRIGNTVTGIDSFRSVFYNPDVVRARLAGEPDPPSKANVTIQQAAAFMPPEVSLSSETHTVNSSTTTVSVSIADKNLPIRNIKIMVNGRLLGTDELSTVSGASGLQPGRASLTVTGGQKTLNLTLPVNLDPGDNRIEVVAFNGYADAHRYIDLTWNAPAGTRPPLPPRVTVTSMSVSATPLPVSTASVPFFTTPMWFVPALPASLTRRQRLTSPFSRRRPLCPRKFPFHPKPARSLLPPQPFLFQSLIKTFPYKILRLW